MYIHWFSDPLDGDFIIEVWWFSWVGFRFTTDLSTVQIKYYCPIFHLPFAEPDIVTVGIIFRFKSLEMSVVFCH